MSNVAIRTTGLGKRYRLGETESYRTLRDTLTRFANAPFCRQCSRRNPAAESTLWALRDVSFDVPRGEVLGIIGRNGAGKSTLLKVLSRITEPTEGSAEICGRVASLLEVGTGFHPELSGRENIFLYGTIMGMRRAEIRTKFDEIVGFAEVERFVDTPVKRYSSGMYTRLAFSVAAHLEPEILIVDEVLAVGDVKFQKKCLGKMSDVASQRGRTVLFVSHNMDAVRRLCDRAIWLDGGRVQDVGTASHCVSSYLLSGLAEEGKVVFDPPRDLGNRMPLRLLSAQITDEDGSFQPIHSASSPLVVRIEWENTETLFRPRLGFVLQTDEGLDVLTTFDASAWRQERLPAARRVSTCRIPGQLLNEGQYLVDIGGDGWVDTAESRVGCAFHPSRTGPVLRFEIEDNSTLPSKHYGQHGTRDVRWPGVLLMDLPWEQETLEALSPAA